MGFPHMVIFYKQFRRGFWYELTNQNIPNFFAKYIFNPDIVYDTFGFNWNI